jgi:protein SCO1/2
MFEKHHRGLWLGGTLLIGAMLGLLIVLPWFPMVSSGKRVQLEFLKSETSHALLFFGFPGCGEICPIAMERLYAIKSKGGFPMPIKVGLVNIAPEIPAFAVSEYAKAFDPEFEGYHLSQEDLSIVSEELGLSLPSANAALPTNFSHPDALFLLEHVREDFWELKQVFSATRLTQLQLQQSL